LKWKTRCPHTVDLESLNLIQYSSIGRDIQPTMLNFTRRKKSAKDRFSVGFGSDVGLLRTENQDSVGVFSYTESGVSPEHLFIVADGMGGHENGREASQMAVKTFENNFMADIGQDPVDRLRTLFRLANERILSYSQLVGNDTLMGTTCTVMAEMNGRFWIGHVGDSRAYRIDNQSMTQVTVDHSLLNELVRNGTLTQEEAENDPRKHNLIQAMGVEQDLNPDIFELPPPMSGERILLCSDGLADVPKNEVTKIVLENDSQTACDKLIAAANHYGGPDNITVIVYTPS